MSEGPFIVIRHHVTASGKRSYRWTCRVCDVGGINRFDRLTDYTRRRRPDRHPWLRCLTAVAVHLGRAHTPAAPNACRWCSIEEGVHVGQWSPEVGWHTWAEPTDRQRKARMLARRAARTSR